jgi:hypothetical protein
VETKAKVAAITLLIRKIAFRIVLPVGIVIGGGYRGSL